MKVAGIVDLSTVDGPGNRLTIFMTGCIHDCDECHNKLMQRYEYGVDWEVDKLVEYIRDRKDWISGLTLSGGDPLYQLTETLELVTKIRKDPELKRLNIWLYTGYLFEDIPNNIKIKVNYIVDGKYDKSLPKAAYRGSNNQRIWKRIVGNKYERAYDDEYRV